MKYPQIIQGGMGVAVSSWSLARAVSVSGELGVVSGTALDAVFARRLQTGDPGGHMRHAVEHFPLREMAERVWERYFVEGGKGLDRPFKSKPVSVQNPTPALLELTVLANFVEVFLAKHGHDGLVGINLLEKIQLPTLPSLFGAMLAKVDYVLMGAGIPRAIPAALDRLSELLPTSLKLDVAGAKAGESFESTFDPAPFCLPDMTSLTRPKFLAIISSATLALTLARKSSGKVDGFIVEGKTAGGHNAPPRGTMQIDEMGEPVYGPRDVPNIQDIKDVGLPFWLAGSYGTPEKLTEARALGAEGIQVGTVFAFCKESGIAPNIKKEVLDKCRAGDIRVFTDPQASPTGFPFKVVPLAGSAADPEVFAQRKRICDLGYLRHAYRKDDGTLGYRCPAEPDEDFIAKGGQVEELEGRKCVCNGLMATIGLAQVRKGEGMEAPLITAGDDLANLPSELLYRPGGYSAFDVITYLRGQSATIEEPVKERQAV